MSKLIYLIQLWGGASNYLIRFLQVLQNRAARIVTRSNWYTPTEALLAQCGWLSVKQLIEYHSLLLVYKIRTEGKPVYLKERLSQKFSYETRFAATNAINQGNILKSELHINSFVPRASRSWNNLPGALRQVPKVTVFKKRLKSWIKRFHGVSTKYAKFVLVFHKNMANIKHGVS